MGIALAETLQSAAGSRPRTSAPPSAETAVARAHAASAGSTAHSALAATIRPRREGAVDRVKEVVHLLEPISTRKQQRRSGGREQAAATATALAGSGHDDDDGEWRRRRRRRRPAQAAAEESPDARKARQLLEEFNRVQSARSSRRGIAFNEVAMPDSAVRAAADPRRTSGEPGRGDGGGRAARAEAVEAEMPPSVASQHRAPGLSGWTGIAAFVPARLRAIMTTKETAVQTVASQLGGFGVMAAAA